MTVGELQKVIASSAMVSIKPNIHQRYWRGRSCEMPEEIKKAVVEKVSPWYKFLDFSTEKKIPMIGIWVARVDEWVAKEEYTDEEKKSIMVNLGY